MPITRTRAPRHLPPHRTLTGRPIITLTTDFGLTDSYVAAMKAVLLRQAAEVRLIDVTHQVPPQDVLCGSITLERAIDGFPPGTVHLAVVDPGVGTDRRMLICDLHRQFVVCPDNGLITWPMRRHGPVQAYEITWRPPRFSDVFHGRDIMAPVAGMVAAGKSVRSIAEPINDPILLDVVPVERNDRRGQIIHIDHFGNATTNVPYEVVRAAPMRIVRVKGRSIGRLHRTYSDVTPGDALALIGSSGLLEIAVRDGSAAQKLKLRVGDEVVLR